MEEPHSKKLTTLTPLFNDSPICVWQLLYDGYHNAHSFVFENDTNLDNRPIMSNESLLRYSFHMRMLGGKNSSLSKQF